MKKYSFKNAYLEIYIFSLDHYTQVSLHHILSEKCKEVS